MRWMVFDVESVGLHGEGFAVGWVVIDERGVEYSSGEYGCPIERAEMQDEDSQYWCRLHCKTPDNVKTPRDVRDEFWAAYSNALNKIPGMAVLLAAECPWPVESRFLVQALQDNTRRLADAPYPLIDIASVRLAAGLNPLETCRRYPEEMPTHSALADARQSARLLLEALQIINRGVVLG